MAKQRTLTPGVQHELVQSLTKLIVDGFYFDAHAALTDIVAANRATMSVCFPGGKDRGPPTSTESRAPPAEPREPASSTRRATRSVGQQRAFAGLPHEKEGAMEKV